MIIAAMVRTKDPQSGSSAVVVIGNQVKQLPKELSRTKDKNGKASLTFIKKYLYMNPLSLVDCDSVASKSS